jgi:hypothetical protein
MPSAESRQSRTTLRQRADQWFGVNHLSQMQAVRVGRRCIVFISDTRLWIYDEELHGRPSGSTINLRAAGRAALAEALGRLHA